MTVSKVNTPRVLCVTNIKKQSWQISASIQFSWIYATSIYNMCHLKALHFIGWRPYEIYIERVNKSNVSFGFTLIKNFAKMGRTSLRDGSCLPQPVGVRLKGRENRIGDGQQTNNAWESNKRCKSVRPVTTDQRHVAPDPKTPAERTKQTTREREDMSLWHAMMAYIYMLSQTGK